MESGPSTVGPYSPVHDDCPRTVMDMMFPVAADAKSPPLDPFPPTLLGPYSALMPDFACARIEMFLYVSGRSFVFSAGLTVMLAVLLDHSSVYQVTPS